MVASHCDLPSAWKDGRERALDREYDLMRPWGANKYLGVMLDVEDVEPSTNSAIPLVTATTNDDSELDEDILSLKEALTHDLASGNPNTNTTIPSASDSNTPTLIIGPGINPDDFLLVDGKCIHKETICRRVLNKFCIAKSLNWQERVYSTGFTKVNWRHELPGRSIFLTIVRCNATLTIALIRSTLIEHHGITCHDILVANIGTPEESTSRRSPIFKAFALNNLGNTWIIEEAALSLACDTIVDRGSTPPCFHDASDEAIVPEGPTETQHVDAGCNKPEPDESYVSALFFT
ncbi:hypothetical protein CY34DRAFT_19394 [Suillus luteus UH-Slu-Lm8-n1]|uniref:Uncharacterized protein n=1 Tax=Suillus luteus UH-Slu-Lm8-n1 TaxID=930992 RepID=A0A0C9ZRQ6_9AGAM|nr:hypothetical protein CY34DRAFT_19394 [Suillus luteus UH-Slu-Lm8-n1]